jgi:hypothetical protein
MKLAAGVGVALAVAMAAGAFLPRGEQVLKLTPEGEKRVGQIFEKRFTAAESAANIRTIALIIVVILATNPEPIRRAMKALVS